MIPADVDAGAGGGAERPVEHQLDTAPELDAGPIILQRSVPVFDDDTPETLAARILVEEHRLYPEAVALVIEGGWSVEGRRFVRSRNAASA